MEQIFTNFYRPVCAVIYANIINFAPRKHCPGSVAGIHGGARGKSGQRRESHF